MEKKEYEKVREEVKGVLDDAMRFGAALASFKEAGENAIARKYLARATIESFDAAQEVFFEEIDSIFKEAREKQERKP